MEQVVPETCTLPTAEQPLRLAEFDELFAAAARDVEPQGATRARMFLSGPVGLADRVRDLAARERACCSFFTFATLSVAADGIESVVLEIEVPPARADVLAALVRRAVERAPR